MSTFLQPIDGYPPTALLLFLQSAPPPIIFVAFQADCNARGIEWYSTEGQIFAVNLFLKHPVSHRYPPRPSTLRSFLKQYISLIEQPHIMSKVMEANGGLDDPIQVELMEALIGLNMSRNDTEAAFCYKSFFNPYLERNMRRASSTALSISNSDINGDYVSSLSKREREKLRHERRETMSMFCPIRVSTEQFRNVGHALWPAAFVLVQLLAQEIKGTTHLLTEYLFPDRTEWDGVGDMSADSSEDGEEAMLMEGLDEEEDNASDEKPRKGKSHGPKRSPDGAAKTTNVPAAENRASSGRASVSNENSGSNLHAHDGVSLLQRKASTPTAQPALKVIPEKEQLHLLELGAGVGLTPILLHRMRAYRQYVANFTITDYQATLTENMSANLKTNKVTTVSDYDAAAHGLEGKDKTAPFHMVSLLDWNDDVLTQQSQVLNWKSDVVLAADCIYDVDVIPGLVRTIKTVLSMRYISSVGAPAKPSAAPPPPTTTTSAPHSSPQRRLSRHLGSGFRPARSGSTVDNSLMAAPYDPLMSSSDSVNNSLALDVSYDLGVDFASLLAGEPTQTHSGGRSLLDGARTPSLRSPMVSSSSLHNSTTHAPTKRGTGNSDATHARLGASGSRAPASLPSLSASTTMSAPPTTHPRTRVCIVVQTHRQASTMKIFFDAVREFANVQSYVLERMPVLNLESQLSKGRDCKDGGVVPIGDYNPNHSTAVFQSRDRWVCALRPDVVLPDGNLKSVVAKAAAERAETKLGAHGLATAVGETTSWSGSAGSAGASVPGPTGSATASWSAVSSFSTFTTADVDALLKDEMIGPFFTSMAGLIGVHVITLKS